MLITAILLSRSCPIVDLKNVLMRRRALKDLSAEHEVAGILARMEVTLYRTGNRELKNHDEVHDDDVC